MKALLRGSWLGSALLLLAGCQSGQQLLLPETTAYSSPCLSDTDTAVVALPTADSTALLAAELLPLRARSRSARAERTAQFLAVGKASRTVTLSRPMVQAQEALQLQRIRRQPFRFRRPQDETEGNPWLLALGIILIAAGIVGGLLIGGGLGIFAGILVGLLGYYFFMRGLLGPHAWLEAIQELFQL